MPYYNSFRCKIYLKIDVIVVVVSMSMDNGLREFVKK